MCRGSTGAAGRRSAGCSAAPLRGAGVAGLRADVARQGDRTIHTLAFPWTPPGLDARPPRGSAIGFAMVAKDVDETPDRRNGLALFGGIVGRKDPAAYGRLWLR